MKRTEVLQEVRKMRFEQAHYGRQEGRLSQQETAVLIGMCDRSSRRYRDRYESCGMDGLMDKRLSQAAQRAKPQTTCTGGEDVWT